MLPYNDPLSLALLFHLNSEPWLNAAAYDDPHAHAEFKNVESTQECVTLPDPDASQVIALASRRLSCRDFNAQPLTVKELATVLHAAYGIVGVRAWPNGRKTFARAVPSAGGLYPLELYVACDQVEGVASGIYHFELRERRLEPVAVPCSIQELVPDLLDQHYVCGAAALLLFTAGTVENVKEIWAARLSLHAHRGGSCRAERRPSGHRHGTRDPVRRRVQRSPDQSAIAVGWSGRSHVVRCGHRPSRLKSQDVHFIAQKGDIRHGATAPTHAAERLTLTIAPGAAFGMSDLGDRMTISSIREAAAESSDEE